LALLCAADSAQGRGKWPVLGPQSWSVMYTDSCRTLLALSFQSLIITKGMNLANSCLENGMFVYQQWLLNQWRLCNISDSGVSLPCSVPDPLKKWKTPTAETSVTSNTQCTTRDILLI
jgi:hypothetical protein